MTKIEIIKSGDYYKVRYKRKGDWKYYNKNTDFKKSNLYCLTCTCTNSNFLNLAGLGGTTCYGVDESIATKFETLDEAIEVYNFINEKVISKNEDDVVIHSNYKK